MTDRQEVGPERLLAIGKQLTEDGERWHHHVLSADCALNQRQQCALILEASDRSQIFVTYSDEPMMDVGRSLAELVHGADVLQPTLEPAPGRAPQPDSPAVAEMMRRARALTANGKHWHHHVLFPECWFNPHPGDWTLVFEDPDTGETLESVTTDRPDRDIRITERLFFSQSVHS